MIEKSLAAYLLKATRVTALTTAIFGVSAPQGQPLPYITYARVSGDHQHHLRGASGVVQVRIQIDAYGTDYANAKAIGEAIRQTIDGYRGPMEQDFVQSIRIDNDEDSYSEPQHGEGKPTFIFSSDYMIWFTESVPITV